MAKATNDLLKVVLNKCEAGLMAAVVTHAEKYRERVSAVTGERPIPFSLTRIGPPGPPYRSSEGMYPYVDPDTTDRPHGYEQIGSAVRRTRVGVIGRSGVKEGGLHLVQLSHGTEAPNKRLGMDTTFMENLAVIREAFKQGARSV